MEAGNQGGEGEQSMAPNWSPKIKVAREKMPVVRYPTDFFFKTTKKFNIQFSFVVLQHKHLPRSENS